MSTSRYKDQHYTQQPVENKIKTKCSIEITNNNHIVKWRCSISQQVASASKNTTKELQQWAGSWKHAHIIITLATGQPWRSLLLTLSTSSNRRLESAFVVTGLESETIEKQRNKIYRPEQTGQTNPDQSRSQALSPPPLQKKICGGCQMCVPRSTDRPTTSPIKSRLKSVLGSVLPTLNVVKCTSIHSLKLHKNRWLKMWTSNLKKMELEWPCSPA